MAKLTRRKLLEAGATTLAAGPLGMKAARAQTSASSRANTLRLVSGFEL